MDETANGGTNVAMFPTRTLQFWCRQKLFDVLSGDSISDWLVLPTSVADQFLESGAAFY